MTQSLSNSPESDLKPKEREVTKIRRVASILRPTANIEGDGLPGSPPTSTKKFVLSEATREHMRVIDDAKADLAIRSRHINMG